MVHSLPFEDLTGKVFGRLTVVSRAPATGTNKRWNCICECGKSTTPLGCNLKTGQTTSCGCWRNEVGKLPRGPQTFNPDRVPRSFIDLSGKVFGRLTVLSRAPNGKSSAIRWNCVCICGTSRVVYGRGLKDGSSTSCGCYLKEAASLRMTVHGATGSKVHNMWMAAKHRAADKGIPFTITLDDIPPVPEFCPVLGIHLMKSYVHGRRTSPTLDRFIPELGYIPGNVDIISHRANALKSNATLEEVQMLADYMKRKTGQANVE